ncbi:MAG: hypothetical protein H7293_19985 [Candidatus Saccharibacteria bacterium]|nr:hypothetical protein [Rhodoferax sp.]
MKLVSEQAEDEALWCKAHTIIESLLQAALRKLHAAIEAQPAIAQPEQIEGDAKDAELLDWIAVHGSFGTDSMTGKVGGNGQKCNAATRKNIIAAIASTKPAAQAEPQDAKDVRLNADEIYAILSSLDDHNGYYFEPECPGCTAYKKLAAIASQKGAV